MKLFTSDTLEVSRNEHQNRLILHCHGEVGNDACKAGFLLALQHAKEHQVKSWLLDFSQVEFLSEDTDSWIQVQIFPQIMAFLGTGNFIAIVVPDACYQLMMNEYGLAGLKTYNSFIIINTFSAPEPASEWLEANAAGSA